MTSLASSLRLLAALTLAALPALADNNTQVSPGIGPLPVTFAPMGGIVIDMVGANGKRLSAQISPTNLPTINLTDPNQYFWAFWSQTGFDAYTLQTLLGGGLQKVNIRITLQDGDSGSPNPVYSAIFGANSMPFSGAGARTPPGNNLPPSNNYRTQPPGWDFDAGTDLYIAIPLAGGGYINCGYMGQTSTFRLNASGNTIATYTGFPGVYAIDMPYFASTPKQGNTAFAVTGWFSVPSNQLAALYSTLSTTSALTLGIWDIDPGEQYYDFTQGVASTITDVPLIPPTVISFTATPTTVVGSGTVTLSWQTTAATSVAIDQGVVINPAQLNGSVQVPLSAATTYTLTASSPQGSTTATATVTVLPPFNITTAALPSALAGSPYSTTITATGGTPPDQWTLASGALPPGLTLSSAGTISGTPTAAGSPTFVIQANDNTIPKQAATAAYTLTVNPGLSIPPAPLPNAVASSPYTQPLTATGGTPGYTWSIASGSLPPGLTLAPAGTISGTPTSTGSSSFTLKATDSTSPTAQTTIQAYSINVGAQLAVQTNTLPTGVINASYSQRLAAAGGTLPYTWSLASGPLPAGLTLAPNGTISGTPTSVGVTAFVARVTDSTTPAAQTATQDFSLYIVGQITIDTISLPDATASHPYAYAINAHNGVQPYVWTLAAGTLPHGLYLLATGALIGTPNIAGAYSFTLLAGDSSIPVSQTATHAYTLTVAPAFAITTSALPGGSTAVPYSATLTATDGLTPYSYAVVFGYLPPGLTLSTAGQLAGTPTKPGIYNMLVRATDSTAPTPQTCDQPLTLTIDSTLTITTPSLPNGAQALQYTFTLTALNGLQPYTWTVTGGTLPDGLSLLLSGTIVGAPTKPGTFHFTIQANDSSQPTAALSTRAFVLAIDTPLTIANASLPNGLTGAPYVAIFTTTGGQPQYTYSLTSGALPPGLTLSPIGVLTGTPSAPGSYPFTIQVSDSNLTPAAVTQTYTIGISQPLNITSAPGLPPATLTSLYSFQATATGGIPPYTWTTQSPLPNGIQLLSTGILIGVPIQTGAYQINLHISDLNTPTPQTTSLLVTLTVTPPLVITSTPFTSILPSVPYSASAQATGGVPPYAWSLVAGSFPTGLNLNPQGTISGITSSSGSYTVQLTVTDSASTQNSTTQEFILLVAAPFAITTTSPLQTAILGKSYSLPLALSGGQSPYVWSVVGGSLTPGLSISAAGVLSGSPSAAGLANFVLQCKDAANETAIKPLTLLVQPPLGIVSATIPPVVAKTVYFHLFQASDGTPTFHWTITGSLPAGLTLTDGGLLTGDATTPGTYPLTLTVTDASPSAPQSVTTPISLLVIQPLTPVTQSFTAYTGAPFSQPITATGGTTPYTWTVASGKLPQGLTLTGATISGTATLPGQYPVVLNVADSTGLTTAALYAFSVTEQLTIPLPNLPTATNGLSYAAVVSAFGGSAPYGWRITSGTLPPGLTLTPTGIISGTPSAIGLYNFTATVTDSAAQLTSKPYTLTVQAAPAGLTIPPATAALPPAVVGLAYVAPLTVTGGTPPYTWALAPGASLPTGFTLNGPAVIGTPATPGTYSFALSVTDATGLTATSAYVVTITAGLTITTMTLPTAVTGKPYADLFTAAGGTTPYTWTGAAPFGLNLSSTGVLSGTPTAPGGASLTITVTDSSRPPHTNTKTFSLASAQALAITTSNPPQLTVGTPAALTLQAQGGTSPYAWAVVAGILPPGLTVTAAGAVTGSPIKAGAYMTTLSAADASLPPLTVTSQILFTVLDPVTISTTTLPTASTGLSYTATLQAQGGTPPYTWALASGALPPGLSLIGFSLTGWPSNQGTSTFVLKASDISGLTATQSLKLTVAGPLTITSTTLPIAPANAAFTYPLQAAFGTAPYAWTILSGGLPAGLMMSASGAISGMPTAAGTSLFIVKVTDAGTPQQSATAVLTLTVNNSLTIVTTTIPQATATILYRVAFAATAGTAPYTWRISLGSLPTGLTLTSSGVLTGTPVSADAQDLTIQVTDSQHQIATGTYHLVVAAAPIISLQLSPAGTTLDPQSQTPIRLNLASPYPASLTGHLTLSGTQDPDAAFIQTGHSTPTVAFTIPAGTTAAIFADTALLLQAGTSAQPFTVTAATDAPPQAATQQYSVLPMPPQVTNGQYTATPDGFAITLTGYSTTREVQTATFRFYNKDLSSAPFTMPVSDIFRAWYQSPSSPGGGLFFYRQPFALTGLGAVTSVQVTLTNSAGTSATLTLSPEVTP